VLLYRDLAALLLVTLLAAIADQRRNLFWMVVGVPAGEIGYRGIVALSSCPSTPSRQEVSDNRDSHNIWQKNPCVSELPCKFTTPLTCHEQLGRASRTERRAECRKLRPDQFQRFRRPCPLPLPPPSLPYQALS